MEALLTNNIFFIYLLGVLVIVNYEAFEKRQKVAIIYTCTYGLTFNNDLRCVHILVLLWFVLFLYEEYLNDDLIKIKYVTNILHKFKDFVYMYIVQYKLIYIVVAISLNSDSCLSYLKTILSKNIIINNSMETIILGGSILFLIVGVHKMFNNEVELKTFKQINQKFSEYPYYQLPLRDQARRDILFQKLELVADIEDYTFFMRTNSYSAFSIEFICSVIRKKREQCESAESERINWINNLGIRVRRFLTIENIILLINRRDKIKLFRKGARHVINYVCMVLRNKFIYMGRKIKRCIRGYSTIEMQLMRILAYKKGLHMGKPKNFHEAYLIITRKIFEIIYAPIFFAGHKKYLNISKERDFYRYYLVYIYLHTVQTNLNGKVFSPLDKIFGNVDVIDWPMEALFIIVLGLNNMKITHDRINAYTDIVLKYQLDKDILNQLVDCIQ